jgi:flagellar protein FlaG
MAMEALNIVEGSTYAAPVNNSKTAPVSVAGDMTSETKADTDTTNSSTQPAKSVTNGYSDDPMLQSIEQAALEGSKNGKIGETNDVLKKAVEKMNENMPHTRTVYSVHEATDRIYIKLVDKESDKVVKEYPPEELLDMYAKALELAGILVDEKR